MGVNERTPIRDREPEVTSGFTWTDSPKGPGRDNREGDLTPQGPREGGSDVRITEYEN